MENFIFFVKRAHSERKAHYFWWYYFLKGIVLLLEKKIFLIKNTKKMNIILKPSLNADQPTWQITTKYFSCNYFENYVYAVILFVYGDSDLSAFRFRRNNLHHLHYFTAFHEFLKIFQEFSNLKKTFTL